MNKYITDLYEAFNNVCEEFYCTESVRQPEAFFDGRIPKTTFIQQTELQFSAELYSEWRQIIKIEKDDYHNLKIGFEVSKKFIDNIYIKDQESFRPDLILHQSQIDFNPDFQKIYIEVKANHNLSTKKIMNDIKKIALAMTEYRFECGVFICINCNIDRLKILIAHAKIKIEKINKEEGTETNLWENIYLISGFNNHKRIIKFSDINLPSHLIPFHL